LREGVTNHTPIVKIMMGKKGEVLKKKIGEWKRFGVVLKKQPRVSNIQGKSRRGGGGQPKTPNPLSNRSFPNTITASKVGGGRNKKRNEKSILI